MCYSFAALSARYTMHSQIRKRVESSLKKVCNLSATQARILYLLAINSGVLQISEIALRLKIKPNTATSAIARLEEKELVLKQDNNEDYRIVNALITNAGVLLVKEIYQVLVRVHRECFDPICEIINKEPKNVEAGYKKIYRGVLYGKSSFRDTFFLWQNYYSSKEGIAVHAKNEGLSLIDYRVLLGISTHNKGITPSDLALNLLLKLFEVSNSVRTLSDKGYVKRTRANHDRRSIVLEITNEGFTLLKQITPKMSKEAAERSFATCDDERSTLTELSETFNTLARKNFRPH